MQLVHPQFKLHVIQGHWRGIGSGAAMNCARAHEREKNFLAMPNCQYMNYPVSGAVEPSVNRYILWIEGAFIM